MFRHAAYLLLTPLVLTAPALADGTFRCPKSGKIVHEGDSQYEVETKCGAPNAKSPLSVTIRNPEEGETNIQGEEWVYDFGPNAFVQKLRFTGTSLVKITSGGYGTPGAKTKK